MSSLTVELVKALDAMADEVYETFSAREYRITNALSQDPSFRDNKRPLSALRRNMVVDAITRAAARSELLHIEDKIPGGGVRFCAFLEETYSEPQFMLRTASINRDGDFEILASSDPTERLGVGEPETLFLPEPWVFGLTSQGDGVDKIFAAQVLRVDERAVPRLVLGPITLLGTLGLRTPPPPTQPTGFVPDEDETLKGFEDEHNEDDEPGQAPTG